jgi:Uma2 family endonuclease
MTTSITSTNTNTEPLLLNVSNTILHITPEEFDSLCLDNPDLKLELTKDLELIIMPPTGGESGERNGELVFQVVAWNKKNKLGRVFDSSTGYDFIAIAGGKMSPDVSWIEKSRLKSVNIEKFIPVVPDFVIELRSHSDKLKPLQSKMKEYQCLGVKLGLLINPQAKQVEIYQLEQDTKILDSPTTVDCNWLMPGFSLDLTEIF